MKSKTGPVLVAPIPSFNLAPGAVNYVRRNEISLPPAEVLTIDQLRGYLEAAMTRVKFYGESIGREWLEDLIERVGDMETNEEAVRTDSYDEGYTEGQKNCECEASGFEEKYDALKTSLRNTLEDA